jgi:Fe-S cluster biosynthesis and repair protein YggX
MPEASPGARPFSQKQALRASRQILERAGGILRGEALCRSHGRLGIRLLLQYLDVVQANRPEESMADEKCGDSAAQAASQPAPTGARMVKCVKYGKEMPGLDRIPWKGELGKRVYESVSKEAWKMWIEHSKMVMNEFRLNPLDPNSQKIIEEQMEQFFFGEGARLPEGYVPPKSKS